MVTRMAFLVSRYADEIRPLNTESGRSSLSIEIQKYELPHMEVDIKIDSRRVINSRLSYDDDVFE